MALSTDASEPNAITFKFALWLITACSAAAAPAAAGTAVDSLTSYLSNLSQAEPNLCLHIYSVQRAPPSQFFFCKGLSRKITMLSSETSRCWRIQNDRNRSNDCWSWLKRVFLLCLQASLLFYYGKRRRSRSTSLRQQERFIIAFELLCFDTPSARQKPPAESARAVPPELRAGVGAGGGAGGGGR